MIIRPFVRLVLLSLVFVLGTASIAINFSGASDQTITCNESGCSGIAGPLFSVNSASPLSKHQQTVTAINNAATAREFGVSLEHFSDSTPSLAEKILITIYRGDEPQPIWGPASLAVWNTAGQLNLGIINPGNSKVYTFVAAMSDVGNTYQGTTVSFDLAAGFTASETPGAVLSANNPQVLGATTNSCTPKILWWIPLLIQGIFTLVVLGLKLKRLPTLTLSTVFALVSWVTQILLVCTPHFLTLIIWALAVVRVFIPSPRRST